MAKIILICLNHGELKPKVEMENFEEMAESLETQLKSIKARIEELKSEK